jgi:hypothetical protein
MLQYLFSWHPLDKAQDIFFELSTWHFLIRMNMKQKKKVLSIIVN